MTQCSKLYERADEPWTYRCVLEEGHEGDCAPALRPPVVAAELMVVPISDEELAAVRERLRDPTPKMWNSSTMREVVSRLDASERVLAERTEEVANLSTEGLLRMGNHNSFVRYHAHGDVLWPVYPANGMCRGCG